MTQDPMHTPRVSVLTTTYNGARFLRQTIDSILGQTFRDFEYLLIDDASTDGTVDLIRSYDDPRIRLVRNEANMGISGSRNRAFQMARGEFIATTDQDDLSDPHRLEQQVCLLDARPDISAVASRVHLLIDGRQQEDPMPAQDEPELVHFALYFGRHNTTYSSLCLRRSFVVENDLYFRPQYHYAEDFELCSRIVNCGRFAIVQQPLVDYRIHDQNNSRVHQAEMLRNGMAFMRECYARELGRPLSDQEARLVWDGLVDKQPQWSAADLQEMGRLMSELTAGFVVRHSLSEPLRTRVEVLAAQIWNDVVDRSVRSCGLDAEKVRRQFAQLNRWAPPASRRARMLGLATWSGIRGRSAPLQSG